MHRVFWDQCGLIRLVVYDLKGLVIQGLLWPYKTGVLQCRDDCGVIRPVVYEYMGLIIRERAKLTFLV